MNDWQHWDSERIATAAAGMPLDELMTRAAAVRDAGKGAVVSWSRKVFIPLTELCRDVCHYCTYAKTPRRLRHAYLAPDAVLAIARAGQAQGCREALFTLGDKPELRYRAARDALAALGYSSTLAYLRAMAGQVLKETGLLPHLNPGVLSPDDYRTLRTVAPSMGIMLESASPRLAARGGPHYGSPDKQPAVRLKAIADAGEAGVPLTSGLLIGIGETRAERIASLVALRELHERHGHIQELIIQNFVPKPGTKLAAHPPPAFEELLWTIAVARLLLGPGANLQAPPNLNAGRLARLIAAGINDWGGVSPVTPDHVNPESPWPHLAELAQETAAAGKILVERLTLYPDYVRARERWLDPGLVTAVLHHADAEGHAREDGWTAGDGAAQVPAARRSAGGFTDPRLAPLVDRALQGERLDEAGIVALVAARGDDVERLCERADALRRATCGETVTYVVNRNINYTNLCSYKCQFCAFAKGRAHEDLRGAPYVLDLAEIARRAEEAWARGATEVCLQGGIHPAFTGQTYLDVLRTVKETVPGIHVHAFSPLEVTQGAKTLGLTVEAFLRQLRDAGLGSLPGTAAEILDDEVRRIICPDKVTTLQWLHVVGTAHRLGLPTTATIMFGHLESPRHWARHLLALRDLQQQTGGFTEFVPLPFVHMEAPLYRRGRARPGPTWREVRLMHAVPRLVLHPLFTRIQTSWPKLGDSGAAAALVSGANDLGGTLMNESISRAAGAGHGQEMAPERMDALITACGRLPRQRTTLYREPVAERIERSYGAPALAAMQFRTARDFRAAS
ncbi:MAG: 5-amino-6-(D-ribitylamino)uracil--L-tyrosine 4-hydroxyphenyl transferase CofH [Gammaproteobacteria bacterium]|nr:5-amino-6-(D-ribitylamino)uracil--L-tyrosine 4-hydroxyphenyl transferase CofH [Gammaproteobacteria bacterium]